MGFMESRFVVLSTREYRVFLSDLGYCVIPAGVDYDFEELGCDIARVHMGRVTYRIHLVTDEDRRLAMGMGHLLDGCDSVSLIPFSLKDACIRRVFRHLPNDGLFDEGAVIRSQVTLSDDLIRQVIGMPDEKFCAMLLPDFIHDLTLWQFDDAVCGLLFAGFFKYDAGRDMVYSKSDVYLGWYWDDQYRLFTNALRYKGLGLMGYVDWGISAVDTLWFDLHSLFGGMTEVYYNLGMAGLYNETGQVINLYDVYIQFLSDMLGAGVAAKSVLLDGIPEGYKGTCPGLSIGAKTGSFFYLLIYSEAVDGGNVILGEQFSGIIHRLNLGEMKRRYGEVAKVFMMCGRFSLLSCCEGSFDVEFVVEDGRLLLRQVDL